MIEKFDRIIGMVAFGTLLAIVAIFTVSGLIPNDCLPVVIFALVFSSIGFIYHAANLYRLYKGLKPFYLEIM